MIRVRNFTKEGIRVVVMIVPLMDLQFYCEGERPGNTHCGCARRNCNPLRAVRAR